MRFRVDLDIFRGPLDLLLFLVRKHEVEIIDIPIALITDQFLEHMAVLEQLDINLVGDFLDMASTLMEIKSRMVLPRSDEVEEPMEDPRQELVRKLLEYKKFKDAASILQEHGNRWQQRYARRANDLPRRRRDMAAEPIREVELWDLVSAFGRVVREKQASAPSNIVYDDTPIHVYMNRIYTELKSHGPISMNRLFEKDMHKSAMIGIFLAMLELIRNFNVHAEQNDLFGEVWIIPPKDMGENIRFSEIDSYEHAKQDVEAE